MWDLTAGIAPGQEPRTVAVQQQIKTYQGIYKQELSYLWFGAEPYHSRDIPAAEPIRGRFTYAVRAA